jgi:ParB family chromosome partitioning protein
MSQVNIEQGVVREVVVASSMMPSGESRAIQRLCELPLDLIEPDPAHTGPHLHERALAALAESIRKCGVLEPVHVRLAPDGSHRLVAGARRLCAARIAGLQKIPSLVCRYDDSTTLKAALIENIKREELSSVEKARAYGTLAYEFGLTHQQIADRVGRTKTVVTPFISLLGLSEEILELIERGELSLNHGLALLKAKDPQVRGELARKAAKRGWASKKGWTVAALEARVCLSNEDPAAALAEDVPMPAPGPKGREQLPRSRAHEPYPDERSLAIARAWGDVLGAEVRVRAMRHGRVNIEVRFNSAEAALAAARRLGEEISRDSGDS